MHYSTHNNNVFFVCKTDQKKRRVNLQLVVVFVIAQAELAARGLKIVDQWEHSL